MAEPLGGDAGARGVSRLDHDGRGDYNARHEMPFRDRRANYLPGVLIQPPGLPAVALRCRAAPPIPEPSS